MSKRSGEPKINYTIPENERSHLDLASDGAEIVRSVAYRLESLAISFDNLGMERLSNELSQLSADLDAGREMMRNAHSDLLNQTVRQSAESTGQLLKLALSGIPLGPKRPEKKKDND